MMDCLALPRNLGCNVLRGKLRPLRAAHDASDDIGSWPHLEDRFYSDSGLGHLLQRGVFQLQCDLFDLAVDQLPVRVEDSGGQHHVVATASVYLPELNRTGMKFALIPCPF